MHHIEVKDRILFEAISIISLKFVMLNIIMRAFLKELSNLDIRRETI